ncbi:hypothetical protein [Pedobacter rhizosphaerae]|nr:hypothetical protein [Pedobacter rhizosphaerae]
MNKFMAENGGFTLGMRHLFDESNNRILEAHTLLNIKLLRRMSDDLDYQILNNIPLSLALKLKVFFRAERQKDIEAVDLLQARTIKKILRNSEIANGEEYQLVKGYLNERDCKKGNAKELEKLRVLMHKFLHFIG